MQGVRVCCLLSTLMPVLVLTACAGRPAPEKPTPSSATLAAHGIECHQERVTGSLVAATVCTSAADRARQAADAQEAKEWLNNDKAGPCPKNMQCNN